MNKLLIVIFILGLTPILTKAQCWNTFVYDTSDTLTYTFTGEAYYDSTTVQADYYAWDFGDGNTEEGQTVSHMFQPGGNAFFIVCLTTSIFDPVTGDSCIATSCQEIWIYNSPDCEAMFFYYPSDSMNSSLTYQFVDASWGNHDNWAWDFGDGTTSGDQNPVHSYTEAGTYAVTLEIWDSGGTCSSAITQEVWIMTQPDCEAWFFYYPLDSANASLTFQFMDASWGYPDSWTWDFGDGSTSSEQNPIHAFPEEGSYSVTLTISDSSGSCESSYTEEVFINSFQNECYNFFYYDYEDETTLIFTGQAFWGDTIIGAESYFWDFGDGSSGEGQTITHIFEPNPNGVYSVCLTTISYDPVTNDSCFAISCQDIWIGNQQDCEAMFFYFPLDSMNTSLTYQFMDASWGYPDTWAWEFGDGTTSSEQNPMNTYTDEGTYIVTLSISDSTGNCQSTYTEEIFAGIPPGDFEIWGQVLAGDALADIGQATLFSINPNSGEIYVVDIQPIDSASYYSFWQIPQGNYFLLTELLPGSAFYNDYLPTYYGDVLFWEDALMIQTEDLANPYSVNLIPADGYNPGQGMIDGTITEDGRFGGQGSPVMDINILLFDQNMNGLGYMYSTVEGTFDFSDLPFGTYYIYPEMPGMETNPALVILNEDNPAGTVDIMISGDEVIILAIDDLDPDVMNIRIYPNPAQDMIHVEFEIEKLQLTGLPRAESRGCSLQVYDVNGRILEEIDITSNNELIRIDLEKYNNGLYSVLLRDKNRIVSVQKFVIIK